MEQCDEASVQGVARVADWEATYLATLYEYQTHSNNVAHPAMCVSTSLAADVETAAPAVLRRELTTPTPDP